MRVVYATSHHNRISAKADADYRRASLALCVPSAKLPFYILDMRLSGLGLLQSWNTGNPNRVFSVDAMERPTCDQSHKGVWKAKRCPKDGQT
jgi:hypothetical protein